MALRRRSLSPRHRWPGYHSFFEVFPLVYPVDYGMNLGEIGLVFLCALFSCMIGIAVYFSYIYF